MIRQKTFCMLTALSSRLDLGKFICGTGRGSSETQADRKQGTVCVLWQLRQWTRYVLSKWTELVHIYKATITVGLPKKKARAKACFLLVSTPCRQTVLFWAGDVRRTGISREELWLCTGGRNSYSPVPQGRPLTCKGELQEQWAKTRPTLRSLEWNVLECWTVFPMEIITSIYIHIHPWFFVHIFSCT